MACIILCMWLKLRFCRSVGSTRPKPPCTSPLVIASSLVRAVRMIAASTSQICNQSLSSVIVVP